MGVDSGWAWEINVSNQVNFKIFAGNIEEKLSYIWGGGVCEIYREVLEIFLIVRTTINVCVYMCVCIHIYVCCIHVYTAIFSFHFTSLLINLVDVKLNLYIWGTG